MPDRASHLPAAPGRTRPDAPEPPGERRHPALAVGHIAAVFLGFLLFAQFAFLRLVENGTPAAALGADPAAPGAAWAAEADPRGWAGPVPAMAALAAAGIAASLTAGPRGWKPGRTSLVTGYLGLSAGALTAASLAHPVPRLAAAVASGAGLGLLTTTVAALLPAWVGPRRVGRAAGLGTAAAYAICNGPILFQASPERQSLVVAAVAAVGAMVAAVAPRSRPAAPARLPGTEGAPIPAPAAPSGEGPVAARPWFGAIAGAGGPTVAVAVALGALVFLDSAAFALIQRTPEWFAPTWGASAALWRNAGAHAAGAVLAGWAVDAGLATALPLVAGSALAAAWVGLHRGWGEVAAGPLYNAGVSAYSCLLVAWTGWSASHLESAGRARRAGWVFAAAGWGASTLGIGLALDQGRLPTPLWILGLGLAALAWWGKPRFRRPGPPGRLLALAGAILLAVAGGGTASRLRAAAPPAGDNGALEQLGREVYLAEGCLHCHSQYVRPATSDVERWGPAHPLDHYLAQRPPLFGNRRQGPDLTNVGNRRSPEWNRLHLVTPNLLRPGSRMPSFAHLFRDNDPRGPALLAYLESLGRDTLPERQAAIQAWPPPAEGPAPAPETGRGAALFARWCVTCHGSAGRGDGPAAPLFHPPPRDLSSGSWKYLPPSADPADTLAGLARIAKFGIPGTSMPGQEFLEPAEALALARFLLAQPRLAGPTTLHHDAAASSRIPPGPRHQPSP